MKDARPKYQFAIGSFVVDLFQAGSFLVDGGALFGGLAPEVWTAWMEADSRGRVRIPCWGCVVRGEGKCILTEPGVGEIWPEALLEYADPEIVSLRVGLGDIGIPVEAVTDVVLTHLHYDHCGGVCERGERGRLIDLFPEAHYHVQEWEMSYARSAGPWEREGYVEELVEFLAAHPRMCNWNGPFFLGEGLLVHVGQGHTPCLQWLEVQSGGKAFAHISDIVPTQWHLAHNLASAFDAYPGDLCRFKTKLLKRAFREGLTISWAHDPLYPAVRLRPEGGFEALGGG